MAPQFWGSCIQRQYSLLGLPRNASEYCSGSAATVSAITRLHSMGCHVRILHYLPQDSDPVKQALHHIPVDGLAVCSCQCSY